MKSYGKPHISKIKLDAGQAILAVCSQGGGYLNQTGTMTLCAGAGTPSMIIECGTSARGVRTKSNASQTSSTAPS